MKNQGFIAIPLLIVIALGAVAIGGVSYVAIKNNEAIKQIADIPAQASVSDSFDTKENIIKPKDETPDKVSNPAESQITPPPTPVKITPNVGVSDIPKPDPKPGITEADLNKAAEVKAKALQMIDKILSSAREQERLDSEEIGRMDGVLASISSANNEATNLLRELTNNRRNRLNNGRVAMQSYISSYETISTKTQNFELISFLNFYPDQQFGEDVKFLNDAKSLFLTDKAGYDDSLRIYNDITQIQSAQNNTQAQTTQITNDRVKKANDILDRIDAVLVVLQDKIDDLYATAIAKQEEIERTKNQTIPQSFIDARLAQLIPEYNALVDKYNNAVAEKKRLVEIWYAVKDYRDSGTPVSAADKATLSSYGIYW